MTSAKTHEAIPKYPTFAVLDVSHQQAITTITKQFEPYSDFNFTSLLSWNTDNATEVSLLHGNLVIKMNDYITDEPCLTILGNKNTNDSINKLLQLGIQIKFVPEVVVENTNPSKDFNFEEDRDQFDYIYDLDTQSQLAGGDFKIKRNKINKFKTTYGQSLAIKTIDFTNTSAHHDIHEIFWEWAKVRNKPKDETQTEYKAICRLLEFSKYLDLYGLLIYVDELPVAFSINEKLSGHYGICHFQKSVIKYEHLDVFLTNVIAKDLFNIGCKYVNWEQDLGLPGLRKLKKEYHPDYYLKKYLIKPKS
jgi:hypothetical protein